VFNKFEAERESYIGKFRDMLAIRRALQSYRGVKGYIYNQANGFREVEDQDSITLRVMHCICVKAQGYRQSTRGCSTTFTTASMGNA
jgi:hypothetical protein